VRCRVAKAMSCLQPGGLVALQTYNELTGVVVRAIQAPKCMSSPYASEPDLFGAYLGDCLR
jgi:hypothetical protein